MESTRDPSRTIKLGDEFASARVEAELLAAIVRSSDDAIVGKDLNGRITSWNPSAERIFGYTAEEAVGRQISLIIPPERVDDMYKILGGVGRGETFDHFETVRVRKDGQRITVSLTVSPIRDATGKVIGASKIARDVTEQRRSEMAQKFLSEASVLLASSLDYRTTLNNVANLAVPRLADWCAVDILEPSGKVDRLAVAHVDPEMVRWAREIQAQRPIDMDAPSGVPNVLRTGKSEIYPTITPEMLAHVPEEDLALIEQMQIRSVVLVPLVSRGRTIGVVSFVSSIPGRYGEFDLRLAEELGLKAGLAVDNAWLLSSLQEELEVRKRAERTLEVKASELSILYDASKDLGSTLDVAEVYLNLQRLVAKVMDGENLVVSCYSADDDLIRCEFGYVDGVPIDAKSLPPLPLNRSGGGLQSQVILSGEPMLIGDVQKRVTAPGANFLDVDAKGKQKRIETSADTSVKSMLLVPIRMKDEVIGVVQVMSAREGAYDADNLRMLQALVLQMAAATQNAHLYHKTLKAENRYRTLVSASTSVVWAADGSGQWNADQSGWQAYTNQKDEEQLGEGWLNSVHPADRPFVEKAWEDALESQKAFAIECRIWHQPSSSYHYCDLRSVPVCDADKVLEWVGTVTDIHERKRAERRSEFLLTLNDRIRSLETPEAILHGVVVALGEELAANRCSYGEVSEDGRSLTISDDYVRGVKSIVGKIEVSIERSHTIAPLRQGQVVVVNDTCTAERLEGIGEDQRQIMERMDVRSYIAVPVLKGAGLTLQGVLSVQDSRPRVWTGEEIELTVEAAERAWLAVQSVRARLEIEKLNAELENRVRERTAALEAVNRELEGFSYTVSHDLRGPLRAITSSSMMLIEDYGDQLPADAQHRLKRQVTAANKLARLIDDVLKLSRLTRMELAKEKVDLSTIAREVADEVRARRPDAEPEFTIAPQLCTEGDTQLLKLMLQNLFENSIKFGKNGRPRIWVGKKSIKGRDVFYVQDDGIGFEQQYAEKIFTPFERLHRDEEYPGTGIGLANVRRVIEKHGGTIWAEGQPEQGATFFFTI